jgi:hypothetical protein
VAVTLAGLLHLVQGQLGQRRVSTTVLVSVEVDEVVMQVVRVESMTEVTVTGHTVVVVSTLVILSI